MYWLFKNMKVKGKLSSLVILFILSFSVFVVFGYYTINQIKISGVVYKQIVNGKDLIADILPPPEYIVESYLTVFQMLHESDIQKLEALDAKMKVFKSEYLSKHSFWDNNLTEPKSRDLMLKAAYTPAIRFFDIYNNEFLPAIMRGDVAYATTVLNGDMKANYLEHRNAIDKVVTLATSINTDYEKTANKIILVSMIGLLTFAFLVIVFSLFALGAILKSFKPLFTITQMLKNISEGGGDLTKRIVVDSNDEIGLMAKYFNNFVDKILEVIRGISETAGLISTSSNGLLDVATHMTQNSNIIHNKVTEGSTILENISSQITKLDESLNDSSGSVNLVATAIEEVSGTIRNFAVASEKVSINVSNINDSSTAIASSINILSESSKEVSSSVSAVAFAVKEINYSLNDISKNCERSIVITSDASNKANDTHNIMAKLNTSSNEIAKIIGVIKDIADQTNMLALNAAIEAAGAGEAGKGFAVVATEVKELAKQTAEATEEISLQIQNMQDNMSGTVEAMGTINDVIKEITSITNTIAAAVTEQSATTGEILNSVLSASNRVTSITKEISDLAQNSNSVSNSINESSNGIKDIARSSMELSSASNEASGNMEKISHILKEIAQTYDFITDGSCEALSDIKELRSVSASNSNEAALTNEHVKKLTDVSRRLENLVGKFRI